jgi:hypothetical protein
MAISKHLHKEITVDLLIHWNDTRGGDSYDHNVFNSSFRSSFSAASVMIRLSHSERLGSDRTRASTSGATFTDSAFPAKDSSPIGAYFLSNPQLL